MNGWRTRAIAGLAAIACGSFLLAAALFADGRTPTKLVPDVRGRSPAVGADTDRTGTGLLLDAGFCVDFRYEDSTSSIEREGTYIAYGYFIGDEIPEPGSWLAPGSTVTVLVRGSDLAETDWDAEPRICSPPLRRIPAAA
jgi:hypothetical protein